MGKINQTDSSASRSRSGGTFSGLITKRANIWLTTTVVLIVIVVYMFTQLVGIVAADGSLATTTHASGISTLRSRVTNFWKLLTGDGASGSGSTTGTGSGSASGDNYGTRGDGGSIVVNPGPGNGISGDAIPVGSCEHVTRSIPYTFSDAEYNSGNATYERIAARDAAWRAATTNFPGPNTGPGAPTVAATNALPNVKSLLAIAGKKSVFQFSTVAGKDAFTVMNPQGGITEKYNQKDIVVDWGDRKITSTYVPFTNYDHVYDAPGKYDIKAKAWYFCYAPSSVDVHGRPSTTSIDPTKPQHTEPASPESTFKALVVSAADGEGATLAGPDLLLKNGPSLLTSPDSVASTGKNKTYIVPVIGSIKLPVAQVILDNVGTQKATVSAIAFSDSSVFARQSIKKVSIKRNGAEIGSVNWPILPNNPGGVAEYANIRTAAIGVSGLSIDPGQQVTLVIEAEIVQAKWEGQGIPSSISHQFCIGGLVMPEQPALQPLGLHYRAGGRDSALAEGGSGYTFSFPPGCGEPFETKNAGSGITK